MDEMLKAFVLKSYDWLNEADVTNATFDPSLSDIDYDQCGKSDYMSLDGDDMAELLEFAIEWGKKNG